MEKSVILREYGAGASFERCGRFVARYEFYAARDYEKQSAARRNNNGQKIKKRRLKNEIFKMASTEK